MKPALPPGCPGPENCTPNHGGWHLKREIQLGHILSTVVLAASAGLYITKIDQRIAVVEAGIAEAVKYQTQRDAQQDAAAARADAVVRDQLTRMDAKLDRLIERSSAKATP